MSKFKVTINIKHPGGISTSRQEVEVPDSMDSKMGNSNFRDEMLPIIASLLPDKIGGADWKKKNFILETFHFASKI